MRSINGHAAESRRNLDRVFQALSHPTRRHVLSALLEEPPIWEDELEDEASVVALHHRHLPHLEAAGYIRRNQATGKITRGDRYAEIRPLLRLLDVHQTDLPPGWP